jgi:DNA-binding CsgD family transcriptional regulator
VQFAPGRAYSKRTVAVPKCASAAPLGWWRAEFLHRAALLAEQRGDRLTNLEIAESLVVSPKTVMHHSSHIYRKLGVRGRAEAVATAARTGLLPHSRSRGDGAAAVPGHVPPADPRG